MAALCVFVAATLGTSSARADKKSDAEAKELYQEGTKYYNLGDFAKAVENYKKAYEKKPDPVFLYNIAQAYRLSNDFTQALFFYKSFLRNLPDAPNQAEVERRISEMQEALDKAKATANAPPNGPVAPGGKLPTDGGNTSTNPSPGTRTGTVTGTSTGADTDTDTGTDTGTKVPDPVDTAAASDAGQESGTVPAPMVDSGGAGKKPIYKKWWFWAGIGAVAVGTVAIIAVSSGGGGREAPSSDFGAVDVF
ncbi:MAG: tetratricopeptide repeat protein [Deltaproteobacteria bacterium]|nr:tetratricopeptide repeat protein [Deltaproteobacteria bacterium]